MIVKYISGVINPRRILPRLSIRSKLVIAFVGLSALPMILVSIYGLSSNVRTMRSVALESLTHDVRNIRERTGRFLAGVESDLQVLRGSFLFSSYIRGAANAATSDQSSLLREMRNDLVAFAETKRIYYQIRIVNEEQDEVLRVQCSSLHDSTLRWYALSPEELHHGGESYYSVLTEGLPVGQIAFSPAELLYRGGERIPVVSFAMPLYRSARHAGILIANVFAQDLFQELRTERMLGADEKVVLVASDGHYLYNSEQQHQWNKLLAAREEDNLQKDYSPEVARAIRSGGEGTVTEGTNDIIVYTPLFPERVNPGTGPVTAALSVPLYLFESVPRSTITRDASSFALTFLGFLVLFLGGAIGLGFLATRQFTKPISALRQGAAIISRGDYAERLHVSTGDEIEDLANQFNAMAASLASHEEEIQQHRTHLQQMVADRTKELFDQKEKLQAILDNVASAFVLLDRDYRIQIASAAFASITGLRQEDVLGQDSRVVLWNNGICKTPPPETVAPLEETDFHIDRSADGSGGERYIEHITVPIRTNGETGSLLQVITDITARTRLEQNLIQSEKLMATGEMAAIIAHGFRNSLTSVKMILQLQHESSQLGRSARKSLGVALDSIYRMETMVQELLTFARPSPMEFRPENVNTIVDDALTLVQAAVAKCRIEVNKSLDQGLSPLVLDVPHLKEAIVNVLLNAIQAMETTMADGSHRILGVSTKSVVLSRTLRDFMHPAESETDGKPGPGTEITLRKGTRCVAVRITDTGPGIDRALLPRIFDPFFTTKTNGTGLGLPMVKRTVNAHGGIVLVKSVRSKGTTVDIILPPKA